MSPRRTDSRAAKPKARRTPNHAPPRAAKPNARRALSHVGGPVTLSGSDESERAVIGRALDVSADERATLAHVHGFHSYPARLHPMTAARLIEGLSSARASVLDPFCGSGTSLVEGRRLGRRMFGSDLNPLAIELSRLKSRSTTEAERAAWLAAAERVLEYAEERRTRRAGPSIRYGNDDRALFAPHVLLELDGLKSGIRKLAEPEPARVLNLVLSSILTKVSKQSGDTSREQTSKRLASGFTLHLFKYKLSELAQKSAEYSASVPAGTPEARVLLCDARALTPIRAESISLIVCSPPYPGVYDYADQHGDRLRWLGLDARAFRTGEIGARRRLGMREHNAALAIWKDELGGTLKSLRRVLEKRGRAVLVIADAVLGNRAVYADLLIAELLPHVGLRQSSAGAQVRPHFHGPTQKAFRERPRREHLLVLQRA